MIAWELLARARVPGDNAELTLFKRDGEFSMRMNGRELMNSRRHGSEAALSELACARISGCPNPRILIGGLGMGFTLAAALKRLGEECRVEVAELIPEVVSWNRGPLAPLAGHPLTDKRVTIIEKDVALILKNGGAAYDAILLDVDNGPVAFVSKANAWLYSRPGLLAALAALRQGGVLAVWSAAPDRAFTERLRWAGFAAEEMQVSARESGKEGRHTIWIAVR